MKKMLHNITNKQDECEKNILNEFKDMDISHSSIFNLSGSGAFKSGQFAQVGGSGNFKSELDKNYKK